MCFLFYLGGLLFCHTIMISILTGSSSKALERTQKMATSSQLFTGGNVEIFTDESFLTTGGMGSLDPMGIK